MHDSIKGIRLVCPQCKDYLYVQNNHEQEYLICPQCKRQFGEWDQKACFLKRDFIELSSTWEESYGKTKSKRRFLNFFMKLKAPRLGSKRKPHFEMLYNLENGGGSFKALYIGYNQFFEDRISNNLIQIDVVPKKYVDIVAAGEFVPFPDNIFNLVVISGVIEHTQHPFKVIDEAYRLLQKGGKLYVSSPWFYPFMVGITIGSQMRGLSYFVNSLLILKLVH